MLFLVPIFKASLLKEVIILPSGCPNSHGWLSPLPGSGDLLMGDTYMSTLVAMKG